MYIHLLQMIDFNRCLNVQWSVWMVQDCSWIVTLAFKRASSWLGSSKANLTIKQSCITFGYPCLRSPRPPPPSRPPGPPKTQKRTKRGVKRTRKALGGTRTITRLDDRMEWVRTPQHHDCDEDHCLKVVHSTIELRRNRTLCVNGLYKTTAVP
jgi:hypothetical protein